jgi:signal recognition particle GTPase
VSEINQLLKQYVETKKMMGQMHDPKFMARMQRMAKLGGGAGFPG